MEYKIKNYMEECVDDIIDGVLVELGCCTCDICRSDISAITLNMLPVKYVVTENNLLFEKIDLLKLEYETEIIAAITKAAYVVMANPHH